MGYIDDKGSEVTLRDTVSNDTGYKEVVAIDGYENVDSKVDTTTGVKTYIYKAVKKQEVPKQEDPKKENSKRGKPQQDEQQGGKKDPKDKGNKTEDELKIQLQV